MAEGWKKGACGIDGNETVKLNRATDYTKRGIAAVSFGEPMTKGDRALMGAGSKTWAPASIKQGNSPGRNKGKGHGTEVKAAGGSKYMQK